MPNRIEWVFDVLPPSMARRGGDPASHVFRQNIATFVREVIQNANDQAIKFPEVHFRFIELKEDTLTEFQEAMAWKTLESHLRSAATTKGGRNIAQFLDELHERQRLLLLYVEDRNTVGLTGEELEGDSHFRALCKDTLYSHKQTEGAGGSYGLGKSVLWAFSGLSTVMFNSTLSEHPDGCESPRLIGRTELPSHALTSGKKREWYSGAGWYGMRVDATSGARAESVWGEAAETLAERLQLKRRSDLTGTSLLILGFRDPTMDEEPSVDDLAEEMCSATAHHFWPAITMPGRPLTVWVATPSGGRLLGDKDLDVVRPFVECYRQRDSERETLEQPGDVVVREIPFDVPGRRDGAAAAHGHVRLCVRLAEERKSDPLVGRVAWFRQPGMVIRYWDRRSLALGVRPFHAILACGEARDPESPTPHDHAVERFLRAAEPPGHEDWLTTASLKAEYNRGYAKALDQLKKKVNEALRALVVPKPRQGSAGPDRLKKRFPIGKKGGQGSEPRLFHFSGLEAHFEAGQWRFSGTVKPAFPADSWSCSIRLLELGEDGSVALVVPIDKLDAQTGASNVDIEDGSGRLVAETGAPFVSFAGRSTVLPAGEIGRGELSLEVTGRGE